MKLFICIISCQKNLSKLNFLRQTWLNEAKKNNIEYRPVVSGNLLNHPFLKNYKLKKKNANIDIVNDNGLYLGNNHFIGKKQLKLLSKIFKELE